MFKPLTNLTNKTRNSAHRILDMNTRNPFSYLPFMGPAIIASVAYMDPGNFATNIQAGSKFGYTLLWVVLVANLTAMLFQSLSAKLGIVTGKSLAELCRDNFSPYAVYPMWITSEIAAMATDLAEVLGGAVAITLLFNLPLIISCAIVGIVTYLVLLLEGTGFRPMEIAIGIFVSIIGFSYIAELFLASPVWSSVFAGLVTPKLAGLDSILLAAGIVGATVMPHAIYLHSSLMKDRVPARNDSDREKLIRFSNHEVLFALGIAGLINIAMVTMAAIVFNGNNLTEISSIENAYHTLTPLLGISAAGIFMISLLASGFSSSVVGTMAGQRLMQDFVHFKIPLIIRRTITLAPVFIVVWIGYDVTQSLVISQVILSFVLPIPTISLLYFTSRKNIMGKFTNSKLTIIISSLAVSAIIILNIILLKNIF